MVERAETMRVLWAALVGVRDGDDSIVSGQVYQLAVHSDVPRKDTLSKGGRGRVSTYTMNLICLVG